MRLLRGEECVDDLKVVIFESRDSSPPEESQTISINVILAVDKPISRHYRPLDSEWYDRFSINKYYKVKS